MKLSFSKFVSSVVVPAAAKMDKAVQIAGPAIQSYTANAVSLAAIKVNNAAVSAGNKAASLYESAEQQKAEFAAVAQTPESMKIEMDKLVAQMAAINAKIQQQHAAMQSNVVAN